MSREMAPMRVLLITAITPMLWGTTYAVTTEFLPPGRPLLSGLLRALPAGLALLAITRELPRGAWWWKSAVLGALNIGIFFALLFVTAYRLPGGMAAVLGAVQPLLVAGLSVLLLAERVSLRTVLAGLIGATGVALAVLTSAAHLDPVGVVAGLAGAGTMAVGLVLTKRWGRPAVSLLTATGWQLTAGGLLLVPVTLLAEGPPPALSMTNLAGYAYLSLIGTALAYTLWFRGLELLPATRVSLLSLLAPLTATVAGWAALGQALTPVQLAGMAIAFGAVLWGQSSHVGRGDHPARKTGAGRPQHGPAHLAGGGDEARRDPADHRDQRREQRVSGVVPAGLRADPVSRLDEAGAERVTVAEEVHDLALGAGLDPRPHQPAVRVGALAGDVDEGHVRVERGQGAGRGEREVVGHAGVGRLVHPHR
ncbi:DMT family transporter [Actinoplanes sp. NEAU-A12]|uniref:DMT family transporter n=1 Tax=Actinoplanes sandaracinus TaxID=3045177 RepID=A0ABT6WPF2_9ACTN|nr:DMT family transporter [Actinoplanes sandaracinus]MDI6101604.1 DMT family transporter [Actinoplanes sandaracinus]